MYIYVAELIKKKRKFPSYIMKFRRDRVIYKEGLHNI